MRNAKWQMRNVTRFQMCLSNRPAFRPFRGHHPHFLQEYHQSINGYTERIEVIFHGVIHMEQGGDPARVKEDKPGCQKERNVIQFVLG